MSFKICEDRLCTWDGVHLRYRTWLPKELRSVAILVHGAGEHLELYEHLGEPLVQNGFGFIAYDLRGFGCSEGKRGHVNHFYEYLNDLDQLIHVFRQKMGNIRFYLIGHSLGGLIVARYVQHRPDYINGIVLSAPAFGLRIHIPLSAKWLISIISRVAPSLSVNPYLLIEKIQRIPGLNSIITYNFQTKLREPLTTLNYSFRWVQELLVQTGEVMQYVTNVTVPTLCICGKRDTLIPPDKVRLFFDKLAVQDKEWLLLPDFGHRLLHSEQSPLATNALINWLNRQNKTHY
jgi:lysophospholipase